MTTEQQHTITIPGLPEGWWAVAYRRLENGDFYLNEQGEIVENYALTIFALIVEKIKPRSIKVADTGEIRQPKEGEYVFNNGNLCLCRKPERWGNEHQIWRVVEEE